MNEYRVELTEYVEANSMEEAAKLALSTIAGMLDQKIEFIFHVETTDDGNEPAAKEVTTKP